MQHRTNLSDSDPGHVHVEEKRWSISAVVSTTHDSFTDVGAQSRRLKKTMNMSNS